MCTVILICGSSCCVAGCALPRCLRGLLNTLRLHEKRWVHVLARQATVRGKRQRRSMKAEWQPIGVVWFAARTAHPPWGVYVQRGRRRTLKAEWQPCRFCLAHRAGDAPPCVVRAAHLKNSLSDATHVFWGGVPLFHSPGGRGRRGVGAGLGLGARRGTVHAAVGRVVHLGSTRAPCGLVRECRRCPMKRWQGRKARMDDEVFLSWSRSFLLKQMSTTPARVLRVELQC